MLRVFARDAEIRIWWRPLVSSWGTGVLLVLPPTVLRALPSSTNELPVGPLRAKAYSPVTGTTSEPCHTALTGYVVPDGARKLLISAG